MAQQLLIGEFSKGLTENRTPFLIDNTAFPTLLDFYTWRGRLKRKRGTALLGQLQRQIQMVSVPNVWQQSVLVITSGTANLFGSSGLGPGLGIVPGSVTISTVGNNTFTDPDMDGTLRKNGNVQAGNTINYSTGDIVIPSIPTSSGTGYYSYYPARVVMGLEELYNSDEPLFPELIAFDNRYAYQLNQTTSTPFFYGISYYKCSQRTCFWSGYDYQQFQSANYSGAFWATNNVPGFHYKTVSDVPTVGAATKLKIVGHGLSTSDWIYVNEVGGVANLNGLAFQVASVVDVDNITIATSPSTTGSFTTSGIAQYLTKTLSGDGIRVYDGDMTGGTGLPTSSATGWVNFAPPLTAATAVIADQPDATWYLVGAKMIVPFKDRLLFFGPWIQNTTQVARQLTDTVIWSWNGTPWYNALNPTGETYDTTAYYVDQIGAGGWLSAGISQEINVVSPNEDVLIVGFTRKQARLAYTSNDLMPFQFLSIAGDLGATAPFSAVDFDEGVMSVGSNGVAMTTQNACARIDLDIPDQIFQVMANNDGMQRVSAIRDYPEEVVYITWPEISSDWDYPTKTFVWNYRDNTWGIFRENYTTLGRYARQSGTVYTWATLPATLTWASWNTPWNSAVNDVDYPDIIGGTPQGFVMIRDEGSEEDYSNGIEAISNGTITSTRHCLATNDYIYIDCCLGDTSLNGTIQQVLVVDANTFTVSGGTTGYTGCGKFSRLSRPSMQSKMFPGFWNDGRQTRIGAQKYLLDRTASGQVTLQLFLGQDDTTPWNLSQGDDGLLYSQILLTCPEDENLGMPPQSYAQRLWHRISTSLIGDTVQFGITLSDDQMADYTIATSEIVLHAAALEMNPAGVLA